MNNTNIDFDNININGPESAERKLHYKGGNQDGIYVNKNGYIYVSHDGGKHWDKVADENSWGGPAIRSYEGVIYKSKDGYHWDRVEQKNQYQMELDALRTLMFHNGARFTWDRRVRIGYDFLLRKMADHYRNQVNYGKMIPQKAGWSAKLMRNQIMNFLRIFTHPIGLKKAQIQKTSGMSNYKAFVSAVANVKTQEFLPKNFKNLPKTEQEDIRKPIKNKIMQNFKSNPSEIRQIFNADKKAVYMELINSAGTANDKVTRQLKFPTGLSLIERRLFLMSLVISFFNVIMADDPTIALEQEVAIDFVLFVGGFIGGTVGSAKICVEKKMPKNLLVYCVVASSLLGGVIALQEYHHLNGE